MRKLLVVLIVLIAILAAMAGVAGAIVHGFTPSNECASSDEAGGRQAADNIPFFMGPTPVPETASDGQAQGNAAEASPNC